MNHRTTGIAAALLVATALAGCMSTSDTAATQTASAATHTASGLETASGHFVGASGHETTGTASVFWTGSEWVISLGSDFSFDGAPSPVVALGNGSYDPNAQLGALQADSGAQTYVLPASLDIGDYLQVYIWCEDFAVPLGVADLTLL